MRSAHPPSSSLDSGIRSGFIQSSNFLMRLDVKNLVTIGAAHEVVDRRCGALAPNRREGVASARKGWINPPAALGADACRRRAGAIRLSSCRWRSCQPYRRVDRFPQSGPTPGPMAAAEISHWPPSCLASKMRMPWPRDQIDFLSTRSSYGCPSDRSTQQQEVRKTPESVNVRAMTQCAFEPPSGLPSDDSVYHPS